MQDNKRPQENERTVRDALHSRAFKNGAYASVLCAVMLALVAQFIRELQPSFKVEVNLG